MKKALALLAIVAAGSAAAAWWLRPEPPEWTTGSDAAREEFQAGRAALRKLYSSDALEHFQRALELDPEFTLAKLMVVQTNSRTTGEVERQRVASLVEELKAADLEPLTPRERMLVRQFRARLERQPEEAREIVQSYLAEHPEDPYAVELACGQALGNGRLDEAQRCFERLIELDPNWIEAQNLLGYLAMGRGDFGEAEEQFQKYRYIAPDQANPHDSLGELYTLVGRYDEAETEFEAAVAAKSDFCASWGNLVLVALLEGDVDRARQRVDSARAVGGCRDVELESLECRIDVWTLVDAGRLAQVVERSAQCPEVGDLMILPYWAALVTGDEETVTRLGQRVDDFAEETGGREPMLLAARDHLAAARHFTAGHFGEAAAGFLAADGNLQFASQQWVFKLFNRLALARALEAAGRSDEAAGVRAELAEVNPRFAAADPFRALGPAIAR
jgi:Flp pilus assembly protein TadD